MTIGIEISNGTKKYALTVRDKLYNTGRIWISRQDNERAGEGMEIAEESLFKIIDEFYEKNM